MPATDSVHKHTVYLDYDLQFELPQLTVTVSWRHVSQTLAHW